MTDVDSAGRRPASLQRRVLVIAAAAFLVVAGLIGWSANIVTELRDVLDEQRLVLVPARRLVAEYDVGVREQLRAERGFIISGGDESLLEPYRAGSELAASSRAALERRLRGDAEGLRLLGDAHAAHRIWVDEAAEPAIAAMQAGSQEEAAATVSTLGRSRFDRFQSAMDLLEAHIDARMDRTEEQLASTDDRLQRLLFGAGVAALVILVLVLAALDRWVITPVERLSAAARDVAAGDLSRSVSVSGPREVLELAGDVDAMRLRIVAELEDMRRANEALEQQAPLVVGLRDVLRAEIATPPNVDLASLFLPAEGVLAGDWFDLWTLDDERVALVVVDISGHGADAGLFALRLKDLLVSSVAIFPQPGAALTWVAERLGDTGERFATIFLAIIDVDRGRMVYASAGHPVVFLASPSSIVTLLPTGPLLGPLRGSWDTTSMELGDATTVVAYTDGLIEARSQDQEEFGSHRLVELVTRLRGQRPHEIVEACRSELDAFAAGRFGDDVTLVAVATHPR